MPTLEEKLTRHFNILHSGLLHKNLCGFIGVNPTDDTITIYHDGSIRVDKKVYPVDYPLSTFLREMENKYQTFYSELKNISDVLFEVKEKMKNVSRRVDGNGHSSFYPEMLTIDDMDDLCEEEYNELEPSDMFSKIVNSMFAELSSQEALLALIQTTTLSGDTI